MNKTKTYTKDLRLTCHSQYASTYGDNIIVFYLVVLERYLNTAEKTPDMRAIVKEITEIIKDYEGDFTDEYPSVTFSEEDNQAQLHFLNGKVYQSKVYHYTLEHPSEEALEEYKSIIEMKVTKDVVNFIQSFLPEIKEEVPALPPSDKIVKTSDTLESVEQNNGFRALMFENVPGGFNALVLREFDPMGEKLSEGEVKAYEIVDKALVDIQLAYTKHLISLKHF